jgi:hypothetical protein
MRYFDMYPAKLRLYRAILNTSPEELRPNEVEIGVLLAGDKDIQAMFDKVKRELKIRGVIDDLIDKEAKDDNKI